jgi:hypothetical protein
MTLVWNTALPWPLIVGLGLLLGMLLFLSYRKPRRAIPPVTRAGLFGLRTAVLLLLLFFLARPGLEGRSGVVEQNRVIVLVDSSRSMTIRDEGARTRHEAVREAWKQAQGPLADLGKVYRISTLRFGSEVQEARDLSFEPAGERTWIGTALADALSRSGPGALEHVVLLSDGRSNGGKDPLGVARAMESKGIRLHTVWAGKPAGSMAVTRVVARAVRGPEEVMTSRAFEVTADFLALGGQGQDLAVDFLVDGAPVATKTVALRDASQTASVSFTHQFAEEGSRLLAFSARPLRGEAVAPDQTGYHPVRVRRKVMEVLYIEGQIRDEFKYIRRSLSRFGDLKLSSVLTLTPEPGQEGLPRDVSEWLKYDVVLLGDVPAASLTGGQRTSLEEAVRKGPGIRDDRRLREFRGGRLRGHADRRPAAGPGRSEGAEDRGDLRPRAHRSGHPGDGDAAVGRSGEEPRPVAVAAEAQGVRRGRREEAGRDGAGAGPVGSGAADGAGLRGGPVDGVSRGHDVALVAVGRRPRGSSQAVLAADGPLAGPSGRAGRGAGAVKIPKTVFEPGEGVRFRAEVTDGAKEPVEGALLQATLEGPDGKRKAIRLDPEPGGYGETFVPQAPGRYRLEVSAERTRCRSAGTRWTSSCRPRSAS